MPAAYHVEVSDEAQAFIDAADRPLQQKLLRCLDALARDPTGSNNCKRLKGRYTGLWRYRVGDWRVVYQIIADRLLVDVIEVAHRSRVYE